MWRSAFLFFCGKNAPPHDLIDHMLTCSSLPIVEPKCSSCFVLTAGSILFAGSCWAGLFACIADHIMFNRLLVAYPYAFGSLLYTWGAHFSVLASAATLDSFSAAGKASPSSSAQMSAVHSSAPDPVPSSCTKGKHPSSSWNLQANAAEQPTPTVFSSIKEPACSTRGTCEDNLHFISTWPVERQHATKWSRFRSLTIAALSRDSRLRIAKLSDRDWAFIDWTGGRLIRSCKA